MWDIILNSSVTPSSALELSKGLNMSASYACAGFKDYLPCPHTIKEPERRREAGPVNKGSDLSSLQPESIRLRRCQASSPQILPRATYCPYLA